MLYILPELEIYSTRNMHCTFLVLVMNIKMQLILFYLIVFKLFYRLMEVAEKEDRERQRETEIASFKAFIKLYKMNWLLQRLPRYQDLKCLQYLQNLKCLQLQNLKCLQLQNLICLQLQNLRCLHHQSHSHLHESCKNVSSLNFLQEDNLKS